MKKLTLLFVCFFCLSGMVKAQDLQSSSIGELLDRLSQAGNQIGSVSELFTAEEQQMLQHYFATQNQTVELPAAYYNFNAVAQGDRVAGTEPTTEVDLNAPIPFTGTYYFPTAPNALVYDNGPHFNIAGSPNLSRLEDLSLGMGIYGFGAANINGFRVSDDMVLTADTDITSIDVYSYQTGSTSPSITAVYMQVWDGDPSAGGTVIWGDVITNIIGPVALADTLRELESAPGDTSRPIQRVTANTTGLSLPAGTYWIDYTLEGSGSSGPWTPAIAILGQSTTGNGLQFDGTTWVPLLDVGPQGLPFQVYGDLSGGGGPATVFGIENGLFELISFDPTDPATTTVIGPSPVTVNFENAGAVDPNNPTMAYVLDNGGQFFSVDLTTGTYTNLGAITGADWVGAEFDPTTGILYATGSNNLYTIDIAAVTKTLVGSMGLASGDLSIALAIDGAGNCYTYELVSDAFYSVDLATGAATPIGSIGFDANFGQGMCWDASTDTVYMSAFNSGTFMAEWRTVDVATGNTTLVGPIISLAPTTQVAWCTMPAAVAGTAENALAGFVVYPNPSSHILNLKSVNTIDSVAIFNILGQKVLGMNIDALTSEINVSSLNTGTYILKVSVGGQIGTYKVLIN